MKDEIRFTVEELGELSERMLTGGEPGWRPTPRKIRYYTTLGLIDRPSGPRGKKKSYIPRHLLQLLSIKMLKSEGRSLEEIAEKIDGLCEEELRHLIQLPTDWLERVLPLEGPSERRARRRQFWDQIPTRSSPSEFDLVGITLVDGLTLLVERRLHPQLSKDSLKDRLPQLLRLLQVEEREVARRV